jgi:hypothetical protein
VGTITLRGEQGWVMHDPAKLKEHKFKVDLSETRELVWVRRGTKETVPAALLAEKIVKIMLATTLNMMTQMRRRLTTY